MKTSKMMTLGATLLTLTLAGSAVQAASLGAWGPAKGDWDFNLGGGGTSNKDFSANGGAFNATVGYFLSDALELAVRQSVNFAVADSGDAFGGQTMLALDYHFSMGERWRPFVGVNAGGMYGDFVRDSWAAGLEAGIKYYALQKTYIFGSFGWAWNFDTGGGISNNFSDGAFIYTAGVGFNF